MANYGPRKPIHMQDSELSKSYKNPSFESFRDNEIHTSDYKEMEDRPSTHAMASMRRYPNGELEYQWAVAVIMDALHKAERGMFLTPLEESMISVVFPEYKSDAADAALAQVRTKLSQTEKENLKMMVEAQLKEEFNYNAGRGGGNTPGRTRTLP
jgi:hypothetical protein